MKRFVAKSWSFTNFAKQVPAKNCSLKVHVLAEDSDICVECNTQLTFLVRGVHYVFSHDKAFLKHRSTSRQLNLKNMNGEFLYMYTHVMDCTWCDFPSAFAHSEDKYSPTPSAR